MNSILKSYEQLLHVVDSWFSSVSSRFPEHVACVDGCSGCCRGLFDITIPDAALLQQGFTQLSENVRAGILDKARKRLEKLQAIWPELAPPFILNLRPEQDWEELMPDEDETPCPLLDENGRCLVYAYRPMTCRLHGLPLVDLSGEIMHDEWCTENFATVDPLGLPGLSAPFRDIFRQEAAHDRLANQKLLGEAVHELDTFIPLALLYDINLFDWRGWWNDHRAAFHAASAHAAT